jgi:synaptobrevin family protein YKT6
MKLISVILFRNTNTQPVIIAASYFLSSFGFFEKSTVKEMCTFMSREIVRKTATSLTVPLNNNANIFHSYAVKDVSVTCISDNDYPDYVVKELLVTIYKNFINTFADTTYVNINKDMYFDFPWLDKFIIEAQNPVNINKIVQIKTELAETENILLKTLDQLYTRQDELNDLVRRTEDLSEATKIYVDDTKKLNSCCIIL